MQDLIARTSQPKIDPLDIQYLTRNSNSKFFITYDLHRADMAVWMVGRFAALYSKENRVYIDSLYFCSVEFIFL